MVKIKNFNDFENRVLGGDGIDLEPEKETGISGSFVILFKGVLNESTANRLKRTIIRHYVDNGEGKDIYLGVRVEGSEEFKLIKVGNVLFSFQFYKEVESVFSQYSTNVEYKYYDETNFLEFNPDHLISTIKFRKPTKKEILI